MAEEEKIFGKLVTTSMRWTEEDEEQGTNNKERERDGMNGMKKRIGKRGLYIGLRQKTILPLSSRGF